MVVNKKQLYEIKNKKGAFAPFLTLKYIFILCLFFT